MGKRGEHTQQQSQPQQGTFNLYSDDLYLLKNSKKAKIQASEDRTLL
jgi:hypothetical protein